MKLICRLAMLAALAFSAGALSAHADPIYFYIDDPVQYGNPGDTLTYHATIGEANGFLGYVNADGFSVDYPVSLDDSPFFYNFPQLFYNYSYTDDVLFTLTLPSDITPGTYAGSFSLFGGYDVYASDPIGGSQDFNVIVPNSSGPAPTPEPSSLALLATGLAGAAGFVRKKWRSV